MHLAQLIKSVFIPDFTVQILFVWPERDTFALKGKTKWIGK